MLQLLPLLGKRIEDLSLDDLTKVRDALNLKVDVTPELRDAGIALLKGENIDDVSDMIKSPEAVQKLMSLFARPIAVTPQAQVIRCPHCEMFFLAPT